MGGGHVTEASPLIADNLSFSPSSPPFFLFLLIVSSVLHKSESWSGAFFLAETWTVVFQPLKDVRLNKKLKKWFLESGIFFSPHNFGTCKLFIFKHLTAGHEMFPNWQLILRVCVQDVVKSHTQSTFVMLQSPARENKCWSQMSSEQLSPSAGWMWQMSSSARLRIYIILHSGAQTCNNKWRGTLSDPPPRPWLVLRFLSDIFLGDRGHRAAQTVKPSEAQTNPKEKEYKQESQWNCLAGISSKHTQEYSYREQILNEETWIHF